MEPDQLIEKLTQAWAGDLATLLSLYHPECVFLDKAFDIRHDGHEGIRQVFTLSFLMMPDFRVTYGKYAITELAGAVEWFFTGSFRGEFSGKMYDGVPVRIEGVSLMVFRDGLIAANTDYWDVKSLSRQLGQGME
jgi:steroid delta-isomerase-like uncharacterized protein